MHANLNNNNIKQFFIDFTYNIIPIAYKPYKLLTIKGFNVEIKQSVLCSLICLKYEDENSIIFAMKYLHDIFNFNPVVINIDYSLSLNNALINNKIFDKQPIILNCFFYYTQAIVRKMKKLNLFKNQKKVLILLKI